MGGVFIMNSYVELDTVAVKGKTEGVKIYTLAKLLPEHKLYLDAYYSGNWKDAVDICNSLIEQSDDLQQYYRLMLKRISMECPSDFNGIWKATSK